MLMTLLTEFQKLIEARNIKYLVHFTPTINLFSILENDELMSRATLENLDIEQFESVDQIVSNEIQAIDSEQFNKKLLLDIYNELV